MFRFTIIAIGKMKNRSLAALCQDFSQRLKRQGQFACIELKDGDVESEGRRILELLNKRNDARIYALGEEGTTYRSKELSDSLSAFQGQSVVFIVGGAYGLSEAVKKRADVLWSLSPLTFTHEIARMLLYEQLYRAVSIQTGSKYHHE
ncbi:MAG: 50S rRNA methyltransferase [Verrucomicrobia bacterium]|jgi:23S rRNA (pseudouridine1915-N3)-methyltransferase|nr:50S rRNA methyltransferase [Verrucomicrobiota bacterium]